MHQSKLPVVGLLLLRPVWALAGCSAAPSNDPAAESASYHANAGVLNYVNALIGTQGTDPNDNGGMIPSVGVPFGMTRWVAQTRENYISQVPYSNLDGRIHGFQGTHQPAIWMGENGHCTLMPGVGGEIQPLFQNRGLSFNKNDENSTPYVYEVILDANSYGEHSWDLTEEAASEALGDECPPCPGGAASVDAAVSQGANGRTRRRRRDENDSLYEETQDSSGQSGAGSDASQASPSNTTSQSSIRLAMSATAHVGHMRVDFNVDSQEQSQRYFVIQATRLNWTGHVEIDPVAREVAGSNPQRHDYDLGPDRPRSFKMYFVSRFSQPFASFGTTSAGQLQHGQRQQDGKFVGAFVTFSQEAGQRVEVRTGVSYVSIEQARRNLDIEIPDGQPFEQTIEKSKSAWLNKLGRVEIDGVNATDPEHDPRTIFYTCLFHALQYPNDYSEPTDTEEGGLRVFYSGYTDSVHNDTDSYYQSWSLWDTYRAEHSLITLFAPERVDSMMRTLLRIFDWTGRLPLWANMVETNIMVATNANAVLANALVRGFKNFDVSKAWEAVRRDAYEPPEMDTELLYYDREPFTPYESRAGLTSYLVSGWVDNDRWSESASRTLDYAFNDFACAVVASYSFNSSCDGETQRAEAQELLARSKNYAKLWNADTQFMHARNENGSFARNPEWGWTEGTEWIYTFDVMHDPEGLAALFKNGTDGMKAKLDEYFSGGHNMHSNEPSHHVPYLYSSIGYPSDAARQVREVAWDNYNATANGLSGNEDLGQMSAWYVFSALGFYPVNPASENYTVGSPFFDRVTLNLPRLGGGNATLVISAPGAGTQGKAYVKSLTVDGQAIEEPILKHSQIMSAQMIEFEMSDTPTTWGQR